MSWWIAKPWFTGWMGIPLGLRLHYEGLDSRRDLPEGGGFLAPPIGPLIPQELTDFPR